MIPQQQQTRSFTLPIHKYKQQIIDTIRKNRVTVICGETGSGKTTQVPQFLFNEYNRILITQPRRISAITLAQRVSYEMGYELGKEVGYNVRFQQKRTPQTKVTFMTDGMAIRELMVRKHFDVFVLDEAHERSINTDVLISVLKKILFETKIKIKIVIMSATIDSAKFMNFYNTDALINIEGRSYPTEIYNLFEPVDNYMDAMFNAIMQVHEKQQKGDILAFLTGQQEINTLFKKIEKTKQQFNITNLRPLMLYSALPSQYQHEIFVPQKGENPPRRVILATNIAETSVTINGVRYVIDSGVMKIRVYDPLKMIDVLSIVPVSKANALQRSGRAGRQAKGKCFRLFLKNAFDELQDQMTPQILRSELSGPILQLKAIGIESIPSLDFMDRPSDTTLTSCLNLLREIKCLKQNQQKITDYGFEVSKIPMPPILSHLLISSLEFKCSGIVLSMLSILSIESLFYSISRQAQRDKKTGVYQILKKYLPIVNKSSLNFSSSNSNLNSTTTRAPVININNAYSNMKKDNSSTIMSDHLAKVNLLHQYINCKNRSVFCKQNMLNKNNIKRAVLIRDQLEDYLKQIVAERKKKSFFTNINQKAKSEEEKFAVNDTKLNPESISNWLKCMEKCSIYNTAKLSKDGFYLINKTGQKAYIHPESLCFYLKEKPSVIVFNQIVKTTKTYLRDVTPIN